MPDPVSVAIIQESPVFLNLAASMAKAITLAEKAARAGARVITFGETWLPGYPAWLDYCSDVALWDHAPAKEVFARLRQNSIVVPGPETERLAQLAGDHKLTLVIGVNERVETGPGNGTLYNSLLIFGPDGRLANHHRKLVPTYTERLVWGQGDGGGLESVATPFGRVGGLIAGNIGCRSRARRCIMPASTSTSRSGRPCTRCTRSRAGTMPSKRDVSFSPREW